MAVLRRQLRYGATPIRRLLRLPLYDDAAAASRRRFGFQAVEVCAAQHASRACAQMRYATEIYA